MMRLHLLTLWLLTTTFNVLAEKPPLQLAKHYSSDIQLSEYWVSEKLDGFRGYYDGKQLISRAGNIINTPEWFLLCFPDSPLDGEIWLARGAFQTLASIIKTGPHHPDWRKVTYQVFDLPDRSKTFSERLNQLRKIFQQLDHCPQLQLIPQKTFTTHTALHDKLIQLEQQGAEGLMLHRGSSIYQSGRSDNLLKLKSSHDAEATVIGYTPGKGKYTDMVGALIVKNTDGKTFRLGSGLTDKERQQPPKLGTLITYRHSGFTDRGIPRFARYLRVRENL